MFASPDRLEADEGNLHTGKSTNGIPRRVAYIEAAVKATHEDEDECMKGDHICDESITTLSERSV
jgi:hypothetical protein